VILGCFRRFDGKKTGGFFGDFLKILLCKTGFVPLPPVLLEFSSVVNRSYYGRSIIDKNRKVCLIEA